MAEERIARRSEVASSQGPCVIGQQIEIRGSVTGAEDLVVQGRVEGTISLKRHLTIEPTGVVEADVEVHDLTVQGEMRGDIAAAQSVTINANAKVIGNIRAPRVILEDGARFRGSVDMEVKLPEGLNTSRK